MSRKPKSAATKKPLRKFASNEVEEYFLSLPESSRRTLEKFRDRVKTMLKNPEEVISYQIPTFKYNGRGLIAYAAFKNHWSVFTLSMASMKKLKDDLEGYDVSGVTMHFDYDKAFPAGLLKKIISVRKKEIEERWG